MVGQQRPRRAFRVQIGVVDGHVETDAVRGDEQRPEQRDEFVGGEPFRIGAVDGGHDGGVEDIGVEVHPESVELRDLEGLPGTDARVSAPHSRTSPTVTTGIFSAVISARSSSKWSRMPKSRTSSSLR